MRQAKTGKSLDIELSGELEKLINECLAEAVVHQTFVHRDDGKRYTYDCAPQLITASLFSPFHYLAITRSRSPSQWNTRDANLPGPISRVRAHPPPIDIGIRTSGLRQLLAADRVRQGLTCYGVYRGCNVRPRISK